MNFEYKLKIGYQNNDELRKSYNELATKTFGLNFEGWYKNNFWGKQYIPYSFVIDNKVIANVAVSIMNFQHENKLLNFIQLGTVMTDEKYRNRGLIRELINTIFEDYKQCDGFFLFANDSVLDFYPKFGFKKANEYQYYTDINCNEENIVRNISMNNKNEWDKFLEEKNKLQSSSNLEMTNDGLLMFYLTNFMKDNVFFIEKYNTYIIAEIDNNILHVYDIFSNQDIELVDICKSFGSNINKAFFEFPPKNVTNFTQVELIEEDTTLFVLGSKIEKYLDTIKMFPKLSRA